MVLSPEKVAEAQAELDRLIGLQFGRFLIRMGPPSFQLRRFVFCEPVAESNHAAWVSGDVGYSLFLWCNWRMLRNGRLGDSQRLSWEILALGSPRAAKVMRFLEWAYSKPRLVEAVTVLPNASVRFVLTDRFDFMVQPSAAEVGSTECWRLMPGADEQRALSLRNGILEWVPNERRPDESETDLDRH